MKYLGKISLTVLLLSLTVGALTARAQENPPQENPPQEVGALEDNILSQIAEQEVKPLPEDNLQGWNRSMHEFNLGLDKVFVRPIAGVYGKAIPDGVRISIANFFINLTESYSAANNILQGEPQQAGNNIRRFLINSTIGIFGLFDVASEMGHAPNHEDFGQTLAVWGVSDGGYLVLPFFGPGTVRSAFGMLPGYFIETRPIQVPDEPDLATALALQYGLIVNQRANNLEALEDLEANSVDFYSAVSALYWQNRLNAISR